tara:strand:+ start:4650 stop:4778 length:129 start_codon:yes stop_codon:yes gene_type:complete
LPLGVIKRVRFTPKETIGRKYFKKYKIILYFINKYFYTVFEI